MYTLTPWGYEVRTEMTPTLIAIRAHYENAIEHWPSLKVIFKLTKRLHRRLKSVFLLNVLQVKFSSPHTASVQPATAAARFELLVKKSVTSGHMSQLASI